MKKMTILTILALSAMTSAFANSAQNIARVKQAMKSKVGISQSIGDVRLSVREIDSGICGSEGSSIIAEFKVKKLEKYLSRNGQVSLKPKFETIKTYGVLSSIVSEVSDAQLQNEIMDSEACLE